ncbi:nuclear transport factor 2 family protein [Phaeovulum sp. NW3]|uniref:nuclear transport factor 2 family protein n=1 Tax=Phaeovulum sp. NW3 TaxID=2934933 RepID=UPI002022796C|nr:nuclear transport factor 2 family protein [Phaeovulum sp. NW3]MCL7466129.1 nuclear transport factor 2 family protein [Phaeovulum sp. NW3]
MTTRTDVIRLVQGTYYDGIDAGDMARAVSALHPDVDWSHTQVWSHHGFERGEASGCRGRQAVFDLLSARVTELAQAQITHRIEDMIFADGRGAFLGYVEGPGGARKPFMVWFELTGGLIGRYTLRPI